MVEHNPNQIADLDRGLLSLLAVGRRAFNVFNEVRTIMNFTDFFGSCVVIDGVGQGRFTWRQVMEANDLVTFLGNNVAVNAAYFKHTAAGGAETMLQCRSGFNDTLVPEITAESSNIIRRGMSSLVREGGSLDAAETQFNANFSQNMQFLYGSAANPGDTVIQAAVANAMASGMMKLGQQTDMAADYIVSGSHIERLLSYQALGRIASEKLPLLKIIFEAFLYAVFPIIALMSIVSPSKVALNYVKALVWISLWTPIYAIVHFVSSFYSNKVLTEMAPEYGGAFSIIGGGEMMRFMSDIVATSGYLITALPMIAWMLVSNSGAMMAGFAGRVMQGYDSSVQSGAKEIEDGQGRRMGATFAQNDEGNYNTQQQNAYGDTVTRSSNGGEYLDQSNSSSKLMISPQMTEQATQQAQQTLTNSVATMDSASTELQTSNSATLADSNAVLDDVRQQQGTSQEFRSAESSRQQTAATDLKQAAKDFARSEGASNVDAEKVAAYAAVEAGTPSVVNALFGVKAKAGAQTEGSFTEQEKFERSIGEKFAKSEQFAEVVSTTAEGSRSMAAQFGISESSANSTALNSTLIEQTQARAEYASSVQETAQAQEAFTTAETIQQAMSVNQGQALFDAARESGLSVNEVSGLIRSAAAGDSGALDEIRGVMNDVNGRTNIGNDPEFQETMTALKMGGQDNIASTYGGSMRQVGVVDQGNNTAVNDEKTLTKEQVVNGTNRAQKQGQEAINNPGSAQTENGTTETLQRKETELDEKTAAIVAQTRAEMLGGFDEDDSTDIGFDQKYVGEIKDIHRRPVD